MSVEDILNRFKEIHSPLCDDRSEYCDHDHHKCRCVENAIVEALEKQIPKRPLLWNNEKYICPNCHRAEYIKNEPLNTYCGFCGQAIDWS